MTAQTFKTPSGDEMVILSRADYDALLVRLAEAEEDAADVAAYDAAKAADHSGRVIVPPHETLGHYLRMQRKNAGLTQAQLATRTNLAQGYVSDLESGRRSPSPDAFGRIADALDITGVELENMQKAYGLTSQSG